SLPPPSTVCARPCARKTRPPRSPLSTAACVSTACWPMRPCWPSPTASWATSRRRRCRKRAKAAAAVAAAPATEPTRGSAAQPLSYEGVGIQGLGEMPALRQVAAQLRQRLGLLGGLDALGHRLQTQRACHGDDGF